MSVTLAKRPEVDVDLDGSSVNPSVAEVDRRCGSRTWKTPPASGPVSAGPMAARRRAGCGRRRRRLV